MAYFDWPDFLRKHRIEYVTTGPNASRDHCNIPCPWCGQSDPSQHLGISIKGQGYHCWRNKSHSGKSDVRLVRALLHCDAATAQRIVYGDVASVPTEDALVANIRTMRAAEHPTTTLPISQELRFPREFKPLFSGSIFAEPFLSYLRVRGYSGINLQWLAKTYNLQYATKGLFAYRLVIPVYGRDGELLTWTGRTIRKLEEPRYRALGLPKPDRSPPFALCATKETLLGLPLLWSTDNARVLVVVEGPFDAFRLTTIGRGLGVYATCLFGLSVQEGQQDLLQELSRRFHKIVVLLDPDADMHRLRMHEQLSWLNVGFARLTTGAKDPADLSTDETLALCVDLLSS